MPSAVHERYYTNLRVTKKPLCFTNVCQYKCTYLYTSVSCCPYPNHHKSKMSLEERHLNEHTQCAPCLKEGHKAWTMISEYMKHSLSHNSRCCLSGDRD